MATHNPTEAETNGSVRMAEAFIESMKEAVQITRQYNGNIDGLNGSIKAMYKIMSMMKNPETSQKGEELNQKLIGELSGFINEITNLNGNITNLFNQADNANELKGFFNELKEFKAKADYADETIKKLEAQGITSGNLYDNAIKAKIKAEKDYGAKEAEAKSKLSADDVKRLDEINTNVETLNKKSNEIADKSGEINKNVKETNESLRDTAKYLEYAKAAWGGMVQYSKSIMNEWRWYDEVSSKRGREWGLSTQELAKYRKNMMETTRELADHYGMTKEEANRVQEDFVKVTGKVRMMTMESKEAGIAMSKLVSPETISTAIETMDRFGASTNTSMAALATTHESAAALGLDAQATASAFAKNMSLASSHTFSKGVDGIRQMTLLSQSLKFNMDRVADATKHFENIEDAIQNSAKLQMLGGSYAANFGNPMQVMFEAMNDMEGFTKRMVDTWKGKGTFNTETGMVDINAIDKRMIRESAKAMGMDEKEALNIAQREVSNEKIRSEFNSVAKASLSDTEKTAIINRAQWDETTKRHYITWQDENGDVQRKDVSDVSKEDVQSITNSTSVDDINGNVYSISGDVKKILARMEGRVRKSVSTNERETGVKNKYKAAGAQTEGEFVMTKYKEFLNGMTEGEGEGFWGGVGEFIHGGYEFITGQGFASAFARVIGSGVIASSQLYIRRKVGEIADWLKTGKFGEKAGGLMDTAKGYGGKLWKSFGGLKGVGITAGLAIGGYLMGEAAESRRKNGDNGTATQALGIGSYALGGASTGAMIGGALGSFVPILGNGVGALAGGIIGGLAGGAYGIYKNVTSSNTEGSVIDGTQGLVNAPTAKGNATSSLMEKNSDDIHDISLTARRMEKLMSGGKTEAISTSTYAANSSNVNSTNIDTRSLNTSIAVSSPVTSSPITIPANTVTPTTASNSQNGNGRLSVDKIEMSINGTIKLDGGGKTADLDIKKLLDNPVFKNQIADMLQTEFKKRERHGGLQSEYYKA